MVATAGLGRVARQDTGLRWRVVFPHVEHAASSYLWELAASDCSPATLRSYGYALLRWFRFLHGRLTGWERAERVDVRAFVEHLRQTPNPRLLRHADRPPARSMNAVTGIPPLGEQYAARTINHQLSVLFGFDEHACAAGPGPLVNPVPTHRGRDGGRVFAHHNPMENFAQHRRATYRQKTPKPHGEPSPTMPPTGCSRCCAVTATAHWSRFGCPPACGHPSYSGCVTATWTPAPARSPW